MEKVSKWLLVVSLLLLASSIFLIFKNVPNETRVANINAQERELQRLRLMRDSLYVEKQKHHVRLDSILRSVVKEKQYSEEKTLEWIEEYNSSLLEE